MPNSNCCLNERTDKIRGRSEGVPYSFVESGSERSSVLLRPDSGIGAGVGCAGMIWLINPKKTATRLLESIHEDARGQTDDACFEHLSKDYEECHRL